MLRTRDFALTLLVVGFMVSAIMVTALNKSEAQVATVAGVVMPDISQEESSSIVTMVAPSRPDRGERLAYLQEAVARRLSSVVVESVEDDPEEIIKEESSATNDSAPVYCANFTRFNGVWSAGQISLMQAEGALLVQEDSGVTTPSTILQIPLHTPNLAQPTCIRSDVVGVAQDGSLIRNHEANLYSVFGEGTLIGYTLDGQALYGVSDRETDTCGGVIVSGEYRYYLSAKRETVLNCFSGTPVTF